MRLFQDEPKWTPYSRSLKETEEREARAAYINELKGGAKAVGVGA
jgi:1,2-dihydroxy-3-keto-5-methylthiopentene dioxygenase